MDFLLPPLMYIIQKLVYTRDKMKVLKAERKRERERRWGRREKERTDHIKRIKN